MNETDRIKRYDPYIDAVDWLKETGLPVAITLTEALEPSEGKSAIVFPPTFAVRNAPHPYQIDVLNPSIDAQMAKPYQEANNCLIDSVGSQANRMEPHFKAPPLSQLVPQVEIEIVAGDKEGERTLKVNLLDIGHRIADGAVRFSPLREDVTAAIQAMKQEANAEMLAKLAPTSLVFGFWDSRPDTTMFKYGRLLSSTIRATNVAVVKRSAQFNPAFDPSLIGLGDEVPEGTEPSQPADQDAGKAGDGKDPLSKLGLRAAPAVSTHGGVRVFGEIVRRTQISLVGLRALAVTKKAANGNPPDIDVEATLKLRRYILGLALVAGRCQAHYALREGCLLVRSCEPDARLVYTDGRRESFGWNLTEAWEYAKSTAGEFGVGESPKGVLFNAQRTNDEVKKLKTDKSGKKKKGT
jgi:CRISPR-associated protein Csb1